VDSDRLCTYGTPNSIQFSFPLTSQHAPATHAFLSADQQTTSPLLPLMLMILASSATQLRKSKGPRSGNMCLLKTSVKQINCLALRSFVTTLSTPSRSLTDSILMKRSKSINSQGLTWSIHLCWTQQGVCHNLTALPLMNSALIC
jgi:hypothetical protein